MRVPLDPKDQNASRKLAQEVFKAEMRNKIKERSAEKERSLELRNAHIMAHQAKNQKRIDKEMK